VSAIPLEFIVVQPSSVEEGGRLLTEWAKWQRGGNGRGYPSIVPFARLVTPTPADLIIGPLPEEIARTDRAVCELRFRSNRMLWLAIEQHYLCDDVVDVKCARLGLNRSPFYRLVDRAKSKVFDLVRRGGTEIRSFPYAG